MSRRADARLKVFISYPREPLERLVALALVPSIERYRIPRGFRVGGAVPRSRRLRAFVDSNEITPGTELSARVASALGETDAMVVVCSPATRNREWIDREVRSYLAICARASRRARVVPVLVRGHRDESFPSCFGELGLADLAEERLWSKADDERVDRRRRIRIKRDSVVNIVAGVLGCGSPDELMRRDRRRRRAQLAMLALLVLVLAAAAAWYAWAFVIPSESFYANTVQQFGETVGIGPVGARDATRRDRTYRITRRGTRGSVVRVDRVNGRGLPNPAREPSAHSRLENDETDAAEPACSWIIDRDERGVVIREHVLNLLGKEMRTVRYEEANGGSDCVAKFEASDWFALPFSAHGANAVHFRRDARGFDVRQEFRDATGAPAKGEADAYGLEYDVDARGLRMAARGLGADGLPERRPGVRTATAIRCDGDGNIVEERFLDGAGRPVPDESGACAWHSVYDAGNCVRRSAHGPSGEPIATAEGYHAIAFVRDEHGDCVSETCLAVDGSPVTTRRGYARVERRFDGEGEEIETRCFDASGRRALADGAVWRITFARQRRGCVSEERYFDTDDRPCLSSQGAHLVKRVFDERGYLVESAAFGLDGKPVADLTGVQRREYRRARDGTLDVRYFGRDGRELGAH